MESIAAPTYLLQRLLSGIAEVSEADDAAITHLSLDSRRISDHGLFFAVPGTQSDGRDFIGEACKNGAAAVVYEAKNAQFRSSAKPVYPVKDLAQKVGLIASRFYAHPTNQMLTIGVTGTNGKSTCAHLTAQACHRLGMSAAVVGTLGAGMIDEVKAGSLTTPDAISLQQALHELAGKGAQCVVIEASSHGLDQGRLEGVGFDIAMFTNLTHEHLDYHPDVDAYGAAKARLFQFDTLEHAIINIDDAFGVKLTKQHKAKRVLTYGLSSGDFYQKACTLTPQGLALEINTPDGVLRISTDLIGRFNAYNLLAICATLYALGRSVDDIESALNGLQAVAGRMERIPGSAQQPMVIVDYSHTPDALRNALIGAREHTKSGLWCVFGAGGDRDREKRAKMGAIAEALSDHVVLTDDNPRSEPPADIVEQILTGMTQRVKVIHNRRDAIAHCIKHAGVQDVVLIAGKGHETTQTIGDQILPFNDRVVAKEVLEKMADARLEVQQ